MLYFSPNVIRMIKSRRKRWMGHVAFSGDRPSSYKLQVENQNDNKFGRPRNRWVNNSMLK
jgi:hypothetical protein